MASVRNADPVILTATAAYPYVNRERAALALRAELREAAAIAAVQEPDWSTFVVEGPTESAGRHGVVWYEWIGTVEALG